MLVDSLAEDPFRWKLLQALAVAASDPEVQQKAEATATFFGTRAKCRWPIRPRAWT